MKWSIIWDVSFCETCTLTKPFLLAPSTDEYLLLTDRTLGSISARLVPKYLRAWQFMYAAFEKSGFVNTFDYFDLKPEMFKGKTCFIVIAGFEKKIILHCSFTFCFSLYCETRTKVGCKPVLGKILHDVTSCKFSLESFSSK